MEITPFNIRIMDVDRFIQTSQLLPVTTAMIKQPSSLEFHPDGLFSEVIFGRVGTVDRLTTHGYIELNTTIIAPEIFIAITKLSALYGDIMAGTAYARFDPETKDFIRIYGDPSSIATADTGYSFFLKYINQITFKESDSTIRDTRIDLINRYKDIYLYKRFIVEPAGIRDISTDSTGKLIQDDVNKLYSTLLAYTQSLPPGTTSPLYDTIRYNIQAKAVEIHLYIRNMFTGKKGFAQGAYAHRRVALGTRNVISAASYDADRPDGPQFLKPDETYVGLFQIMKATQPLVYYGFKTLLATPIFGINRTLTIPLVNPKTLKLEYQEVLETEVDKFTTPDGIAGCINRFRNLDIRDKPITVRLKSKQSFYLMLVYDTQDQIMLFRSIEDLQAIIPKIDRSKIRPLTWIEAFYLITENAVDGKHCFITRYPVLGDGSCYPSRVHLTTTAPARIVEMINLLDPTSPGKQYAQYPILGSSYRDSVELHSSRLQPLSAD